MPDARRRRAGLDILNRVCAVIEVPHEAGDARHVLVFAPTRECRERKPARRLVGFGGLFIILAAIDARDVFGERQLAGVPWGRG